MNLTLLLSGENTQRSTGIRSSVGFGNGKEELINLNWRINLETTSQLDRYKHADAKCWDNVQVDRNIKEYNARLRQEALERQRLRIQTDLQILGKVSKNKGRKPQDDTAKALTRKYPYNTWVLCKRKRGTQILRIGSVFRKYLEKYTCNAYTQENKKTIVLANSIIRKVTKSER